MASEDEARPSCDGCYRDGDPHDDGCPATPAGRLEQWFLARYHVDYLQDCLYTGAVAEFWQPNAAQRAQARADAESLLAVLEADQWIVARGGHCPPVSTSGAPTPEAKENHL